MAVAKFLEAHPKVRGQLCSCYMQIPADCQAIVSLLGYSHSSTILRMSSYTFRSCLTLYEHSCLMYEANNKEEKHWKLNSELLTSELHTVILYLAF